MSNKQAEGRKQTATVKRVLRFAQLLDGTLPVGRAAEGADISRSTAERYINVFRYLEASEKGLLRLLQTKEGQSTYYRLVLLPSKHQR